MDQKKKNRTNVVCTDPCAPRRGLIDDAKVLLNTVGAGGGFGDEMSGGRFRAFDLDKTFRADGLVAAPRTVHVWRIILRECHLWLVRQQR
jgi:hypothetical protein